MPERARQDLNLRPLAPEASAPGPANAGFSLLITGIWRGQLGCANLPVCGEFGRVWADEALRLPKAELLAGPAANGPETRTRRHLGVVPRQVVHPGLLGGWLVSSHQS